ncbi:MAG: DUF177 domain-containing protein [Sphingobium sp.]
MIAPALPSEFSRTFRLDEIGRLSERTHIAANEAERAALARRFGYVSIDQLEANFTAAFEGETLIASGRLRATLAQPCIATAEPVPEMVDTPFVLRFLPKGRAGVAAAGSAEEMEIDAQEVDTITYSDDRIDMGEAVAETLALSVDPYPRSKDADSFLKQMGVLSEEQASPFAVLLSAATTKSNR